jgi:hypothetical protein
MNHRSEVNLFPLLFLIAGFALVTAGVWWIYHPAAFIVAGLAFSLFGLYGRKV